MRASEIYVINEDFTSIKKRAKDMAVSGAMASALTMGAMSTVDNTKKWVDASDITQQQSPDQEEQERLLALTMWGEARSLGIEGMRAVGHVIMNRVDSSRFGDDIRKVVLQRKQFSCWNKNDPNRLTMLSTVTMNNKDSRDYKMWLEAKKLARDILNGRSLDLTNGALFYHAGYVNPVWADGMTPTAHIGDHIFYTKDAKAKS